MSSMPKNTYEDGFRDGFDVGTTNTIDIVKDKILSLKPRTFEEIFDKFPPIENSEPIKPQSATGKKGGSRKSRKYKSKKN